MSKDVKVIRAGDTMQRNTGLNIVIRVEKVNEKTADCVLVRSGKPKTFTLRTLRSDYSMIG